MDGSGHDIQLCGAVESKLDHIPLAVSSGHEELGNQQDTPDNTHTRDDHLDLTPCPDSKGGCCISVSTPVTVDIIKG